MTTQEIKRMSIEFSTVFTSDLIPNMALLGSFLFVTGLVVGLV